MRTKQEILKKLERIKRNKSVAKSDGREISYIVNCKLEKLFKWVLENGNNKKIKWKKKSKKK